MLPVRSLKLGAVALVGALGSAWALQLLDPGAKPVQDDAVATVAAARPSAEGSGDTVSGALVALPASRGENRNDAPLVAAFDDPGAEPDSTSAALRFDVTADPAPRSSGTLAGADAQTNCAPALTVVPGPAATVSLYLHAPCHADATAAINHEGLRFVDTLGVDGTLELTIPALAERSMVSVELPDGSVMREEVAVPDAALYQRTVLVWNGGDTFSLHAFHDGAGFGDPGHLHAGAPVAAATPGAFVVTLGDPSLAGLAQIAQVHSIRRASGLDARLAVAALNTPQGCGRRLQAQLIRQGGDGALILSDLSVDMAECGAPGAFALVPLPQTEVLASR